MQAVAGGLIVAFTGGLATHIGLSLISEGIGDIIFSVRSALERRFSLN
jgi:hypothetical protein